MNDQQQGELPVKPGKSPTKVSALHPGPWTLRCPNCGTGTLAPYEAWLLGRKKLTCRSCAASVAAKRPSALVVLGYSSAAILIGTGIWQYHAIPNDQDLTFLYVLLGVIATTRIINSISLKANNSN